MEVQSKKRSFEDEKDSFLSINSVKKQKNENWSNYPSALEFTVHKKWNKARFSSLKLPHFTAKTPMFMPVGTQGTIKGLTSKEVEALDSHVILGNTYHLGHRPGVEVMREMGGLHKFMNWDRGLLTDSGGFQMVSLLNLAEITEEGVKFQSPHDGTIMVLTPEHSMLIQNNIGADIMMALDDVVHVLTIGPRVEEAMNRTIRWIDRCIEGHKRPNEQNLFGIIQGGLNEKLRAECLEALIARNLPGYAIGGLSGGESKDEFWKIVDQCTSALPENKPRYLMGVGYSVDLVVCSALGVDMFDCVYPSRTARFGTALILTGQLHLKNINFQQDYKPIEEDCDCIVCKKYTRSYLHNIVCKEPVGSQLLTQHNIAFQMRLMKLIRTSIENDSFPDFVRKFMLGQYPEKNYPEWAVHALQSTGIELIK